MFKMFAQQHTWTNQHVTYIMKHFLLSSPSMSFFADIIIALAHRRAAELASPSSYYKR